MEKLNEDSMDIQKYCFVCGKYIVGEEKKLVTACTSYTKMSLPLKISFLLGNEFCVIVSEEDYICRRCFHLFDHMDKLENNLETVTLILNRHLKTKYNLSGQADSKVVVGMEIMCDNMYDKCHVCGYESDSVELFLDHVTRHKFLDVDSWSEKEKITFICRVCEVSYYSLEEFNKHVYDEHIAEDFISENKKNIVLTKVYTCDICLKTYSSDSLCKNHIISHYAYSNGICVLESVHGCSLGSSGDKGEAKSVGIPENSVETIQRNNRMSIILSRCTNKSDAVINNVNSVVTDTILESNFSVKELELKNQENITDEVDTCSKLHVELIQRTGRNNEGYQEQNNCIEAAKESRHEGYKYSCQVCASIVEYFCKVCRHFLIDSQHCKNHLSMVHSKISSVSNDIIFNIEHDFGNVTKIVCENCSKNVPPGCLLSKSTGKALHDKQMRGDEVLSSSCKNIFSLDKEKSSEDVNQQVVFQQDNAQFTTTTLCNGQIVSMENARDNSNMSSQDSLEYVDKNKVIITEALNETTLDVATIQESSDVANYSVELNDSNSVGLCNNSNLELIWNSMEERKQDKMEIPYYCNVCKSILYSEVECQKHSTLHRNSSDVCLVSCLICNFKLHKIADVKTHICIDHEVSKQYTCMLCNEKLDNRKLFSKHVQEVHLSDNFCQTCSKQFKKKSHLVTHSDYAHCDNLNCYVCDKSFEDWKKLMVHEKAHGKSEFKCNLCGKMLKTRCGLKVHKMSHTGDYPFICEYCGHGFVSKYSLDEHRGKHLNEDRYVCDVCGKGFRFYDTYHKHRKLHDNPYPNQCNICKRYFRSSSRVAEHKRKHHTMERPYKCSYCPVSFHLSTLLKNHICIHTKKYPYTCGFCNKGFTARNKHAIHMSKIHSDDSFIKKRLPNNKERHLQWQQVSGNK